METEQPAVNGHTEETPIPAPPNPMMDKYTAEWKVVTENPSDFNTWTALISTAEKLEDMEKLRGVYDAFLALYPLCYGYWKKYADAECKAGSHDATVAVYERGVASVPYSVDLWGHYASYMESQEGAAPDTVRGIYERGVAYVGTDYNAHSLWDKYLAWEGYAGSSQHVAALYTRLLACPIKELDRYYNSFKEYVGALGAAALMTPEEYAALQGQLEEGKRAAAKAAQQAAAAAAQKVEPAAAAEGEAAAAPAAAAAGEAKPAEGAAEVKAEGEAVAEESKPDVEMAEAAAPAAAEAKAEAMAVDGAAAEPKQEAAAEAKEEPAAAPAAAEAKEEPAAAAAEPSVVVSEAEVKAAWVHVREEYYKTAREALTSRKPYEDAIRRPYFHVKPLDQGQLANWARYLDYMEARGDASAAVILYERCLVACASYPEFWCRYIRYLEAIGSMDNAEGAVQRATLVYCKARPEMHTFAARYYERHGRADEARSCFHKAHSEVTPRNMEALVAAANFEKRQGNKEAACQLYESLLGEERSRESFRAYAFLAMQYALFLRTAYGEVDKARQVLGEALGVCGDVRQLWEAALHFEECVEGADKAQRVLAMYARCVAAPADSTAPCLPDKDREELSLRAVDFADMHGSSEQLVEAERRHAKLFMLPSGLTAADSRKRTHEQAHGMGAAHPAKVMRPDAGVAAAAAAPVAAAAPMAAYGHYPPAPPAAAAAAASYPGYGYGGYGQYAGYGGYGYGY